jgi:Predicted transcriptional regulators
MTWLERLNQLKKGSGKTTDEIAALSGVPKGTLNKLFAGNTKDPQLSTIKAVVNSLGYTLDSLSDPAEQKNAPTVDDTAGAIMTLLTAKLGRPPTAKEMRLLDSIVSGVVEYVDSSSD